MNNAKRIATMIELIYTLRYHKSKNNYLGICSNFIYFKIEYVQSSVSVGSCGSLTIQGSVRRVSVGGCISSHIGRGVSGRVRGDQSRIRRRVGGRIGADESRGVAEGWGQSSGRVGNILWLSHGSAHGHQDDKDLQGKWEWLKDGSRSGCARVTYEFEHFGRIWFVYYELLCASKWDWMVDQLKPPAVLYWIQPMNIPWHVNRNNSTPCEEGLLRKNIGYGNLLFWTQLN